ncbi:type 1 glutamine amidotransferase domain-containing protein [Pseudochelatococcus sp. B33]
MKLNGKRVAILIAPRGTEDSEFAKPKEALEAAGAQVTIVGLAKGKARTVTNDIDPAGEYDVGKTVAEVSATDFDAIVIPGGSVGADKLRGDEKTVAFVRGFFEQAKPVAAICHAPWVLAEADVIDGRKLTSFRSIRTDLVNAGADWVDEEVVVDQGLVTSRTPDDLPAFVGKVVEEVAEGRHAEQAGSV